MSSLDWLNETRSWLDMMNLKFSFTWTWPTPYLLPTDRKEPRPAPVVRHVRGGFGRLRLFHRGHGVLLHPGLAAVAAVRRRQRLSLLGLLHRQHVARVVRSLPAWLPASLPAFARACVGFHISLSLSLSLFHRATGLWWCFCLTSTRTPPATRGGLLVSSTGP